MKRILSLLLVLCTVFGMGISVQAAPIHARSNFASSGGIAVSASEGGNGKPIDVSGGVVVGQVIKTDKIVKSVSVSTASYQNNIGGMELNVYIWNKNYATTVQSNPIATQTFENFADGALLTISVAGNSVAGDVLLTVKGTKEKVGVWASKKKLPCFVNGVEDSQYAANVTARVVEPVKIQDVENDKILNAYEWLDIKKNFTLLNLQYGTVDKKVGEETVKTDVLVDNGKSYYAAFAVDFGNTSPKGAIIDIYNDVTDVAKMQIVADDPLSGEILCEYHVEVYGKDSVWEEIPAKINTKLTGKHIIYLTCDVDRVQTAGIKFTKETPEDSWDEIRLKNFESTNNFEFIDTYSDTWTATDLLGRKLADYEEAGEHNPDKQVGLFFWTWHAAKGRQNNWHIGFNQRVINRYPGPESDITNDYYYEGWSNPGAWNESIYGAYNGFDEWVMRKQMELLAAVGVDGLFFDATNGTDTFTGGYMQLAKTMHEMHNDGIRTPGMSFLLPFDVHQQNGYVDIMRLWETMYSTGLYSDTWYYFDGKPILMGYPDLLKNKTGIADIDKQHEEILDFFTFRPGQASYFKGPERDDHWPWLEVRQRPYGTSDKYGCECVSVGVAMNANAHTGLAAMNSKDVYGRSFTLKNRHSLLSETSKYYGYNFREQWESARELNPEFVFVTGWNEWVAGHYDVWQGATGAYPDQYNDEYSRDIEPTKGELKDVYYYQLADEIRKFKGVRPTPGASDEVTIDISGDFEQWAEVGPDFIGYKGGTAPRDSYVQGDSHIPLTNNSGRNDIVLSKVARDSENLYFYVKTAEAMTPYTDPSWMRLLVNTDRVYKTGWEGYDFILNRVSPTENKATLEKWSGKEIEDWKWETAAEVDYKLSGNEMMIKIPRSVLGVTGDVVDIEFKWNDNMQEQGDIMDVYTNGDTAPIGRFAYHYITDTQKAKKAVDEPVDPATKIAHFGSRFLIMALDKNYAYVYGNKEKIDDQSDITAPVIINDKTMVPVRFLSESLGATVSWDDTSKTVTITDNSKRIRLTLGDNAMMVEREARYLQSPATEIDNRIYVPLRDIVEAMEISCNWVEPGVIIVGPESQLSILFIKGNLERIFDEFGLQYN